MRRSLWRVGVFAVVMLVAAGFAFASPYPDAVMKKIADIQELEKNKKEMPETLPGIPVIKGDEVSRMKAKGTKVIDNRLKTQYDTERIAGARLLTVDELLKNPSLAGKYNKDEDLILYCNGVRCWRSPAAALILQHLGFKKIHWYREGLPDWKKRGYPTE